MKPPTIFIMRFIIFIFITNLFFTCTSNKFDSNVWYNETKNRILKESNVPTAIAMIDYYEEGKIKTIKYFDKGRPTLEKWFRPSGEQGAETYYSRNGKFELRRELCTDGTIAFEGIFYEKHSFGLSTWWRCGNSKIKEGVRFNDTQVGIWKNWNEKGEESIIDYKNENLIDSLRTITNFQNP